MRPVLSLLLAMAAGAASAVPYVPSPGEVTGVMLNMASVGPGDYLIDLGSGDGRIVIGAALRGARAFGVEIKPDLVEQSRANARRAGVSEMATFAERDLFKTDLSRATVVTMYLLPQVNLQLRPKLLALKPGTRIVSHDWGMGEWTPDASQAIDAIRDPAGYEKASMVYFWVVPAQVAGRWCSDAGVLRLEQSFQKATVHWGGARTQGALRGAELRAEDGTGAGVLKAVHSGSGLRVEEATGAYAALAGQGLRRIATGETCPAR